MQISTSILLSTLNANNTKELQTKGVLAKSGEAQVPLHVEAKNKSIGDLIEALFKSVATENKTKESVLNTLKSSDISKNIQNPMNELKELSKQVGEQKTFEKYIPKIEKFIVDIKQIDGPILKEQIKNSGSFMESKLNTSQNQQNPLPKEILDSMKNLESILKSGMSTVTKPQLIINNIKSFIQALTANSEIDKGLIHDIKKTFASLKSDLKIDKQVVQELTKYENLFKDTAKVDLQKNIQQIKSELISHTNKILSNDKISQAIQNIEISTKSEIPLGKEFVKDLQMIIAKVKSLPSLEQPILKSVVKLESFIGEVKLNESKITNDVPLIKKEVEKLNLEVKATLLDLKSIFTEPKGVVASIPPKSTDTITKLIDMILNQSNLFSKESQPFQTTTNITTLIQTIKSELKNIDIKQPNALEIVKTLNSLEQVLKREVDLLRTTSLQKTDTITSLKQELAIDIKSTLLQMKEEVLASSSPKTRESIAQIDKVLNSIDYYQLNSYLTNSTSAYLPFLWNGLEKGEVSFKRLKENRFFCEINLTLKEYGKIDLMVMLYDDNHINLSVFAEKNEFIDLFKEHLKDLRVGLNKLGLVPSNMQFYDSLKDDKIKKQTHEFAGNEQIDMGINIQI